MGIESNAYDFTRDLINFVRSKPHKMLDDNVFKNLGEVDWSKHRDALEDIYTNCTRMIIDVVGGNDIFDALRHKVLLKDMFGMKLESLTKVNVVEWFISMEVNMEYPENYDKHVAWLHKNFILDDKIVEYICSRCDEAFECYSFGGLADSDRHACEGMKKVAELFKGCINSEDSCSLVINSTYITESQCVPYPTYFAALDDFAGLCDMEVESYFEDDDEYE
ncbi:MAG: hypothetical protein ACRC92_26815 [Peptostreptococcaceae bacterium]